MYHEFFICFFLLFNKSISQLVCPKNEAQFGRFMFPCYNRVGKSCTYNCFSDSYPPRLVSTKTVTCTASGSWSGSLDCTGSAGLESSSLRAYATEEPRLLTTIRIPVQSLVVAKCPDINPPANGYVEGVCTNARSRDSCVFGCRTNYFVEGFTSITCDAGKWNAKVPVCKKRDCPALRPPSNGTLEGTCKTANIGQVCLLKCNPGFKPVNSKTSLMCTESGWTNSDPRCATVLCPAIKSEMIENALLEGDCNPGVGLAFCSIWCKKGYALVGKSLMYCSDTGKWLPNQLPSCVSLSSPKSILPKEAIVTTLKPQSMTKVTERSKNSSRESSTTELPIKPVGTTRSSFKTPPESGNSPTLSKASAGLPQQQDKSRNGTKTATTRPLVSYSTTAKSAANPPGERTLDKNPIGKIIPQKSVQSKPESPKSNTSAVFGITSTKAIETTSPVSFGVNTVPDGVVTGAPKIRNGTKN